MAPERDPSTDRAPAPLSQQEEVDLRLNSIRHRDPDGLVRRNELADGTLQVKRNFFDLGTEGPEIYQVNSGGHPLMPLGKLENPSFEAKQALEGFRGTERVSESSDITYDDLALAFIKDVILKRDTEEIKALLKEMQNTEEALKEIREADISEEEREKLFLELARTKEIPELLTADGKDIYEKFAKFHLTVRTNYFEPLMGAVEFHRALKQGAHFEQLDQILNDAFGKLDKKLADATTDTPPELMQLKETLEQLRTKFDDRKVNGHAAIIQEIDALYADPKARIFLKPAFVELENQRANSQIDLNLVYHTLNSLNSSEESQLVRELYEKHFPDHPPLEARLREELTLHSIGRGPEDPTLGDRAKGAADGLRSLAGKAASFVGLGELGETLSEGSGYVERESHHHNLSPEMIANAMKMLDGFNAKRTAMQLERAMRELGAGHEGPTKGQLVGGATFGAISTGLAYMGFGNFFPNANDYREQKLKNVNPFAIGYHSALGGMVGSGMGMAVEERYNEAYKYEELERLLTGLSREQMLQVRHYYDNDLTPREGKLNVAELTAQEMEGAIDALDPELKKLVQPHSETLLEGGMSPQEASMFLKGLSQIEPLQEAFSDREILEKIATDGELTEEIAAKIQTTLAGHELESLGVLMMLAETGRQASNIHSDFTIKGLDSLVTRGDRKLSSSIDTDQADKIATHIVETLQSSPSGELSPEQLVANERVINRLIHGAHSELSLSDGEGPARDYILKKIQEQIDSTGAVEFSTWAAERSSFDSGQLDRLLSTEFNAKQLGDFFWSSCNQSDLAAANVDISLSAASVQSKTIQNLSEQLFGDPNASDPLSALALSQANMQKVLDSIDGSQREGRRLEAEINQYVKTFGATNQHNPAQVAIDLLEAEEQPKGSYDSYFQDPENNIAIMDKDFVTLLNEAVPDFHYVITNVRGEDPTLPPVIPELGDMNREELIGSTNYAERMFLYEFSKAMLIHQGTMDAMKKGFSDIESRTYRHRISRDPQDGGLPETTVAEIHAAIRQNASSDEINTLLEGGGRKPEELSRWISEFRERYEERYFADNPGENLLEEYLSREGHPALSLEKASQFEELLGNDELTPAELNRFVQESSADLTSLERAYDTYIAGSDAIPEDTFRGRLIEKRAFEGLDILDGDSSESAALSYEIIRTEAYFALSDSEPLYRVEISEELVDELLDILERGADRGFAVNALEKIYGNGDSEKDVNAAIEDLKNLMNPNLFHPEEPQTYTDPERFAQLMKVLHPTDTPEEIGSRLAPYGFSPAIIAEIIKESRTLEIED